MCNEELEPGVSSLGSPRSTVSTYCFFPSAKTIAFTFKQIKNVSRSLLQSSWALSVSERGPGRGRSRIPAGWLMAGAELPALGTCPGTRAPLSALHDFLWSREGRGPGIPQRGSGWVAPLMLPLEFAQNMRHLTSCDVSVPGA